MVVKYDVTLYCGIFDGNVIEFLAVCKLDEAGRFFGGRPAFPISVLRCSSNAAKSSKNALH